MFAEVQLHFAGIGVGISLSPHHGDTLASAGVLQL